MLALGFEEKHFRAEAFPGRGNLELFFFSSTNFDDP